MKVLVYTAIFGNKDDVPQVLNFKTGGEFEVRFVCLTDNLQLKSEHYQVIIVEPRFSDIAKNARYYKLHGPPEVNDFDVAIWHDSSIWMDFSKLRDLVDYGELFAISTFHHKRYCAYMEAIACINNKKDFALRITFQMFRYFLQGFPSNISLNETGILVFRKPDYFDSEFQKVWWREIDNWSRRDQLSFAFTKWHCQWEDLGLLDGTGMENDYSEWHEHLHPRYDSPNLLRWFNFKLIRLFCVKLIYEMRRRRS